ncbi:MAG: sugar phosphate isomerase/epimerase [Chloroflexi bacterium]|nr:sugar phosphate isomerase/epimerase [Chloroflexota bacterium]
MQMKLSVSMRVAEDMFDKRKSAMSLEEMAGMAKESGFHAVCMRASQVGTQTSLEVVREKREFLHSLGLQVSMATGDFPIPENNERGPDALRNISPYLDLAEALDCDLLRICMKKDDDIVWAQRASDEAAERTIRLAHQSHHNSLFEMAGGSVDVIRRVGRPNFGIIYEPANLQLCGEDYGIETIKMFEPYLMNVYLQNQIIRQGGDTVVETWNAGRVEFDQVPIWDERGIGFPHIMDALSEIGYGGYVTVHQASAGVRGGPKAAITENARYLRSIGDFEE